MGERLEKILEIFYCYAHEDKKLRDELEKHLSNLKRQRQVSNWHDREISAGKEWAHEIDRHLDTADIILLLVSPDFMNSDYCYSTEMEHALKRHQAGTARVIPVILRPVDDVSAPFSDLQYLPPGGRPVTSWSNRDEAFLAIIKGLRIVIEELNLHVQASADTGDEAASSQDKNRTNRGKKKITLSRSVSSAPQSIQDQAGKVSGESLRSSSPTADRLFSYPFDHYRTPSRSGKKKAMQLLSEDGSLTSELTLGEHLKSARQNLHLSLEEVAGKQYTTQLISQIERNRIEPSSESLQYLAEQWTEPI